MLPLTRFRKRTRFFGISGPSLAFDFANNGPFDPRITFTRASSATYFDDAGTLQSAAINVPRLDYNPVTLAARGLLIEEQRTNLLTYSEDFGNATWTAVRASVSTDATTGPDGATTADKIIEDTTASATHQIQRSISYTSGVVYSRSIFAKAAERTQFRFQFPSAAFTAATNILFDLSAVTANVTSGTATAAIVSVGNGWYRCSATATATVTTSATEISCGLAVSGNAAYTGDGTSGLFIWGAQLEAGAFPTSYIPTTTTALTRSADVASVNTLSPWYNQTQGTLYAEYQTYSASVTQVVVALMDSVGSSNRATVGQSTTAYNAAMVDGGAVQASLTQGTSSINVVKNAFAFDVNDFAFSVNGAAPATDTSGTVSSAFTEMQLGKRGSISPMSGWLRRVTYYPRKLSSAELQSITA